MAKFPTIEEMAQNVAEKALDEVEYNGKTIRQWIEIISASEHSTNLASLGTDCISRQSAIDVLRDYLVGKRCPDDGTLTCRLIENEVINKLPPIQPKRIRGQWSIKGQAIDTVRGYWAKCSACGHSVFGGGNYCSYCGSYNKGEVTK